jgi:probable phosphoglycerate mutase
MSGQVWLIRHGETAWSRTGAHTGRTDLPLTPEGERAARTIGERLSGHPFSAVLTSPLRRAKETCGIAGFGAVCQIDKDLREWDYGAYEGRTTASIRTESPGWSIWNGPVPGGESIEHVAARAGRVIARADTIPGDIALFAHGHLLRVLAASWLGLEPAAGRLFALGTGSISVLGYERDTRVIVRWNS